MHLKHLIEKHNFHELTPFFRQKQSLIPICRNYNLHCENGLDEVYNQMTLNKGFKFLHTEEPSVPTPPGSPKMWQIMNGMADEDYEMYEYENKWDSDQALQLMGIIFS